MRVSIRIPVTEDGERTTVEGILWVGEPPPECRRGKNQRKKNRKYKQAEQLRLVEDRTKKADELTGGGLG